MLRTKVLKTLETELHGKRFEYSISVKLTQLGIDFDKTFCKENMFAILNISKLYNVFVTIDMEDYRALSKDIRFISRATKTI